MGSEGDELVLAVPVPVDVVVGVACCDVVRLAEPEAEPVLDGVRVPTVELVNEPVGDVV